MKNGKHFSNFCKNLNKLYCEEEKKLLQWQKVLNWIPFTNVKNSS